VAAGGRPVASPLGRPNVIQFNSLRAPDFVRKSAPASIAGAARALLSPQPRRDSQTSPTRDPAPSPPLSAPPPDGAALARVTFSPGRSVVRGLGGALVAALAGTSAVLMVGSVRARRRRAAELNRLVRRLAQRDPATASHSRRVAAMVELIANALRLPRADVERARIAALLHDVGKMDPRFTPLLGKEGPLTSDEWAVMRTHAAVGAAIVARETRVRDVIALRGVADAVGHHHEWWDGNGYPDGLRGRQIPLESRIIAIADTLDAMTTDRPYQRGISESGAIAGLQALRGTHLDPRLCERVLAPALWESVWATAQMMREEAHGEAGGIGADDAVDSRSLLDDIRDEYERRLRSSGGREAQSELPDAW